MSWRKSDSFILPPKEKKKEKKLTGLEKIETDILETEIIDGGALIVNNKNMMITSKDVIIETGGNSLSIPSRGPINATSLSPMFSIVNLNQRERESIEININNQKEIHNFIFESREKIDSVLDVKILPYMNKNNSYYDHLIKINFYLDINSDVFVPLEVKLNNESLSIKLNSPHSSFSLVWLPSKRWNIAELGFKTTVLDK